MYIPKHFEVTDKAEILSFIRSNPFGQLISSVKGKPFSSHLPFFLSNDEQSLFCHLAKKNPQWQEIESQEVLVTFQGNHDYISPTWYSSPGVPTWNYQAVHVYGKARVITERKALKEMVDHLTALYESGSDNGWSADYKSSLLQAIIGIEVDISELQGKYKLSQNRPAADQKRISERLRKKGSTQLSEAMILHDIKRL